MADRSSMRVRSSSAALACGLLLAACTSGGDPPGAASGAAASTTTTAHLGPQGPSSGASDSSATSPANTDDVLDSVYVIAARSALDAYLDALAANDFPRALAMSSDAVRSLTEVRSIVHAGNAERGGRTSSAFDRRTFDVASVAAGEVLFRGDARLTSVVSGSSGLPTSTTDTFADVAVRPGAGGWRVSTATYNGKPVVAFAAAATAIAGPVQIELTGAVAFGGSLAVVVRLIATGDHAVDVRDDRLRVRDEQSAATSMLIVSGQPGYLYLTYARRDERPTSLWVSLIVDGVVHPVSLSF